MTYAELQDRKERLIEYIRNEVYNEEQLAGFEALAVKFEGGIPNGNYPEGYLYAPSKEELTKIIEQVLEDDKNGLFITHEEFKKKHNIC